jgi:hypothetical protein
LADVTAIVSYINSEVAKKRRRWQALDAENGNKMQSFWSYLADSRHHGSVNAG